MSETAKGWMSGDPVSISPEASAVEALDLLANHGIRHLPVVNAENRVVGVLSVDDLRAALPFPLDRRGRPSPEERDLALEWNVADVMTHAPRTITEGTDLAEAAQVMAEHRIGCLPVVDEDGRLEGILTETDALHALVTVLWTDRVRERRRAGSEFELLIAQLERERDSLTLGVSPEATGARRLEAVSRALERADQGRLETCERCGGAIPIARLRALPGTTMCIACARAGEEI